MAALVALVTALAWCLVHDRWTVASWQIPLVYLDNGIQSDVFNIFARIRAAQDGHHWPLFFTNVPELGAPYVANWDDYPMSEKPLFCAAGMLARVLGLFAAANLTVMLGQVLAAVSFYASCRILNYERIGSAVGGLVFGLSHFAFAQGLFHLTILFYWHVPLCLVVTFWLFRGEAWTRGRFIFALVVGVLAGVQHIYYANMFAQFALIAGLVQAWRGGWRALLPAAAVVGAIAVGFLLMEANTVTYQLIHGFSGLALDRRYQWLEFYGLKLVDLIIPPADHPFPLFADWGSGYLASTILSPGELPPSSYLGMIGLAALGWLVAASLRRTVRGTLPPLEAFLILWIILYANVGGLNSVVGMLGFDLFRTTSRYSIFILCLVLLYAIRRLSALPPIPRAAAYPAAVLLVVVAWWDQAPPTTTQADLDSIAAAVASDRDFTREMERRLPAHAMVFQIPIMAYPETGAPNVPPYNHFRPYLFSRDLRFSYGSEKGRPEADWQNALVNVPLTEGIPLLESYGFAAVYINLDSTNDRGAAVLAAFRAQGYTDSFESERHDLACVLIHPSPHPQWPAPN